MILSSVCLSVRLSMRLNIAAKRYVLLQKCLNKWIGTPVLVTPFQNFQPPSPTVSLQTPHLLNHLVSKFKPYCERLKTIQISTSGIAIVSMQKGYSRQRCTIGFFSATADLKLIGRRRWRRLQWWWWMSCITTMQWIDWCFVVQASQTEAS